MIRKLIIRVATNALGLYVAALLIDGISYDRSVWTLIITGAVLGLANFIIKPVITFLSLPLILVTFGAFILVINALLLMLASLVVPGFTIDGFWASLLGVIVMFVINALISVLIDTDKAAE
jgi:putative membrane protein